MADHNTGIARIASSAGFRTFLGAAPAWYKWTLLGFLVGNLALYFGVRAIAGPEAAGFITGWAFLVEFIFTLAMSLKCHPLPAGGMLVLEAVAMGLTSADHVYHEVQAHLSVLLLLTFMVAAIYFLKDLLLVIFTRLVLAIPNKRALSVVFCATAGLLSAFLDALTVMAAVIAVAVGFIHIFDAAADRLAPSFARRGVRRSSHVARTRRIHVLDQFRSFLRGLVMHAAVGTALGGVCTMVGEPQNLMIAEAGGWSFLHFIAVMAHVTVPVFISGLLLCWVLERQRWFGFGTEMPTEVRQALQNDYDKRQAERSDVQRTQLQVQAIGSILLCIGLIVHVAEVGLIGLAMMILVTAATGVIQEHKIGPAYEEAMPFAALLVVFFALIAVIADQGLFAPVTQLVFSVGEEFRAPLLFISTGVLSVISDNVFVAGVYVAELQNVRHTLTTPEYEALLVAINTGTNIPSVATPNGQAAFLFLLTSHVAPLIRLSYGRMVYMALPFAVLLTLVALTMTVI